MAHGFEADETIDPDALAGTDDTEEEQDGIGDATREEQQLDDSSIWKNKYIRLLADLENTKKRLTRTAAREVEEEKEALLLELLPVADGLDLALAYISADVDSRNIVQGIELVRDKLKTFFSLYEVRKIESWGKEFDPRVQKAVGVTRSPNFAANTVVKVHQQGYLYRDKLLRPAQVVVNQS